MPDFPRPISRRPAGRAIVRTAEERARVAAIAAADVLNARLLWQETAPRGWEGLIEAKEEPMKEGL